MDLPFATNLFSPARFARYLSAADGDAVVALDLYRWNVELSASFFELVAYLEVAVRNACHSVLTGSQPATVGIPWYLDPNVLSKQALQTVAAMRARIHDETGSESPDQIVARPVVRVLAGPA